MKEKTAKRKKPVSSLTSGPNPSPYPKGWTRQKFQAVLAHYENQTEDEAVAEDEAAYRNGEFAMIQVPIELVPKV